MTTSTQPQDLSVEAASVVERPSTWQSVRRNTSVRIGGAVLGLLVAGAPAARAQTPMQAIQQQQQLQQIQQAQQALQRVFADVAVAAVHLEEVVEQAVLHLRAEQLGRRRQLHGQLAAQVRDPPFSPAVAARVAVRKACARQARVMCRYQAS